MKNAPTRHRAMEIIAAISLGVLSIGAFALQAFTFDRTTTSRETALFGALQFLLTLGFGWMSTRAVSRAEFAASLRQFALSAYRRISDIEDILRRMHRKTDRLRSGRAPEACHDLDLIDAMLEDAAQVVVSSRADWSDVIGDELLTLEAVKTLEDERDELERIPAPAAAHDPDAQLKAIDERINRLVAELPAQLRLDVRRPSSEARRERRASEWLTGRHVASNGFPLAVVAGGRYGCERSLDTIQPGEQVAVVITDAGINVEDGASKKLGRAINDTPLTYEALETAIQHVYGADRMSAVVERLLPSDDPAYKNYIVRITAQPVIPEKKHNPPLPRGAA